MDPYQPANVAATSGNSQHKLLHGVSYVTDDSYNDNWNNVPVGNPSNEYVDNTGNDFVDPFYAKNGNSHMPRQYVGNGGSAPSGTPYRSDFAQYVNHNSDQFVDPFYAKKGNNPTNYNYNAGNSHPSIGSSSWSDVFNKKGLVFVEWPLKSQKSTEPNVVCMDKSKLLLCFYIIIMCSKINVYLLLQTCSYSPIPNNIKIGRCSMITNEKTVHQSGFKQLYGLQL